MCGPSVSQSASQPVSHSVIQSFSQSVGRSVRRPVGRRSVSRSYLLLLSPTSFFYLRWKGVCMCVSLSCLLRKLPTHASLAAGVCVYIRLTACRASAAGKRGELMPPQVVPNHVPPVTIGCGIGRGSGSGKAGFVHPWGLHAMISSWHFREKIQSYETVREVPRRVQILRY